MLHILLKKSLHLNFLIFYQLGDLAKSTLGDRDAKLRDQLTNITSTILSNQTQSLNNLTEKV